MKQKFKDIFKQKPSTYLFGVEVALCVAMFLYALISLINFSTGNSNARYVNIIQIIFSICAILILSIYFAYVKFTKLKISEPFNFYLQLFLFTFLGIYPCFELFSYAAALGIFFAFLGLTFSAIAISIFFYFSKTQNGTVKANPWFIAMFQLGFSLFLVVILEIIMHLVSKAAGTILFNSVNAFISQIGYALIGMFVCAAVSIISIYKSKYFVNMCLIRQIKD